MKNKKNGVSSNISEHISYTDMAIELLSHIKHSESGITLDIENLKHDIKKSITRITNEKASREIGKPIGVYCSIESSMLGADDKNILDYAVKILSKALTEIISQCAGQGESKTKQFGKILVVGLGNNRYVADSLGPKVCDLLTTGENLVTFAPSVSGVTGIKSTTAIKAISDAVRPDCVIVIDSLACDSLTRLGSSYQISSTGIQPGSGVTRANERIDKEFLGCPVIALGVPMVVYTLRIIKNIGEIGKSLHVVPKDIDAVVSRCAYVISNAITCAI